MNANNYPQATDARALMKQQLATWPLARQNFEALQAVETRRFDVDNVEIIVQFNPARIISSAAKTDANSLKARPCFLCPANLPKEQLRLPIGKRYQLLTNPYPIFQAHFTLPTVEHVPQRIAERIEDFLDLTRSLAPFTLFYNGPQCGASAPDHAHFQAVAPDVMPLDRDLPRLWSQAPEILHTPSGSIRLLLDYLRNGFLLRATTPGEAISLFHTIYQTLPLADNETEPRMNLFGYYNTDAWSLVVVPRRKHRPWQYKAEGSERLVSSPGAADIGGLFITARQEDFQKISAPLLRDIYEQVCFRDEEIHRFATKITG